ncbi:hypothetical protein B0T26DRAFT_705961 [Lasiosphaeria miniovina]|uniref:Uncharacterized protein n=1 Tax=Lasiosphaeria miniovina TaxID=1954250 RepID=A0AA40E420_9PEZI|nr:uncharacterized protein B0T26DRAFT_705961 [Lasiosphaeria miniovina]KAK0723276.1 hypothetical protein B0T26DRAFT_705961 [Lasiosphaeria miniovina]
MLQSANAIPIKHQRHVLQPRPEALLSLQLNNHLHIQTPAPTSFDQIASQNLQQETASKSLHLQHRPPKCLTAPPVPTRPPSARTSHCLARPRQSPSAAASSAAARRRHRLTAHHHPRPSSSRATPSTCSTRNTP